MHDRAIFVSSTQTTGESPPFLCRTMLAGYLSVRARQPTACVCGPHSQARSHRHHTPDASDGHRCVPSFVRAGSAGSSSACDVWVDQIRATGEGGLHTSFRLHRSASAIGVENSQAECVDVLVRG